MTRILLVLAVLAGTAHAEPVQPAKHEPNRKLHAAIIGVGGLGYILSEAAFKGRLAPSECRWCSTNGFDTAFRNWLRWDNPASASTLSNVLGFAVTPVFAFGTTLWASLDRNPQLDSVFDDIAPVLESVIIAEDLTQIVKFSAGRQRPYAHFTAVVVPSDDDNLSFFSGHSSLVFSVVTSAGIVAHHRHYKTEPYVWTIGYALAATTAYLRIAADKHYMTDVLTGTAVGVASGLVVPWFYGVTDDERVTLAPTGNGFMVAGVF